MGSEAAIVAMPQIDPNQKGKALLGSKKSPPVGPSEWTPKPEYLIALAPYLGVHW